MSTGLLRRTAAEFLAAVQFLTRIPVPEQVYEADALARSVKFFPVIGLIVGAGAALVNQTLVPHLPRMVSAFAAVVFLVCVTGGIHEDGFADVADAFGGGTDREKILLILRDSRIGSFGGIAIVISLVGRTLLIASLPIERVCCYLAATSMLSRWTSLPLSHFLSPARRPSSSIHGQGARIARLTSAGALFAGTAFSLALSVLLLRQQAIVPLLMTVAVAGLTAIYYKRRIGGITGDCFGATIQLTEIGIYICGAWTL